MHLSMISRDVNQACASETKLGGARGDHRKKIEVLIGWRRKHAFVDSTFITRLLLLRLSELLGQEFATLLLEA